ncbi:cuticle protein AMP1A-like isoform X2 [Artemia franciscana]|uniref:Uncharacterized protein n=1 Tax=Artemia franciscana TaxID=6661 RepID=A0AA88HY58_ARTSF|nr:hypothetical protein QYM36_010691 [Artemia franciscana]
MEMKTTLFRRRIYLATFIALALARPEGDREREAELVRETPLEIDVESGAYKFGFETSNGISRDESGRIVEVGEEKGQMSEGKVTYTAPDGTIVTLTYIADENGFVPAGDHLPVPPAVPDHIVQLLADLAAAATKKV